MAVFGIVAEYNPFHNGHKYQIDKIKNNGENTVVAVMSPNVVQRGDFAFFDKWLRTRVALACGVDLVIELPSFYALSTAEVFAQGAVKMLDSLGCVDYLCFGSESADTDALKKAAELNNSDAVNERIKELLKSGVTYAKARADAICEVCPELETVISKANDILGVEYICSLNKIGSKILPYPIKRVGVEHDEQSTNEEFASASFIRENPEADIFSKLTPKECAEIYMEAIKNGDYSNGAESLYNALVLKLRMASPEQIEKLPDVSEGLENRIIKAAKEAENFKSLCEKIKTKRYTMARIRRILMYALLDFSKDLKEIEPQFIRVLGANSKGLGLLSKKSAKLPVITSLAKAKNISEDAKKLVKIEENCTDAFNLTLQNQKLIKNEFSAKLII